MNQVMVLLVLFFFFVLLFLESKNQALSLILCLEGLLLFASMSLIFCNQLSWNYFLCLLFLSVLDLILLMGILMSLIKGVSLDKCYNSLFFL